MASADRREGRLTPALLAPGTGSFADFLDGYAPDLLPGHGAEHATAGAGRSAYDVDTPHGTTIVAATHTEGVVMAGDRRATMGNLIAQRDTQKVFQADEFSAIGVAGTAGIGI
jgi:proteasome beta subunit